jgi:hypothetical protein
MLTEDCGCRVEGHQRRPIVVELDVGNMSAGTVDDAPADIMTAIVAQVVLF